MVLAETAPAQTPAVAEPSALPALTPWIAAGAALVVSLLVATLVFRRRKKRLGSAPGFAQPVVYQGAVKAIMEGKHPALERFIPGLENNRSAPELGAKTGDITVPMAWQAVAESADAGLDEDGSEATLPLSAIHDYARQAEGSARYEGVFENTVPLSAIRDLARQVDAGKDLDDFETTVPLSAIHEQARAADDDVEKTVPMAAIHAYVRQGQRAETRPDDTKTEVSDSIFRAYDIRGLVGETLTEEAVYQIGRAIGTEAERHGQARIVVGRDGRHSSPALAAALARGLCDSGRQVIDVGMVPTPVLYFATHYLDTHSGVMVTGSHNPAQYNGLKIVLKGQALAGEAIAAIRDRIRAQAFVAGRGELERAEVSPAYLRQVTESVPPRPGRVFKVVVDCGNGVPGILAPQVIRTLGHQVVPLYCEVDGNFPHHHPDPAEPNNLKDLIDTVRRQKADLGLAFDGDGDRLGVVDGSGAIIWPDRQMMLFARDVLSRAPGTEVIYDVKCSRHLKRIIEQAGGKPVMWKTGHSLIKAKMRASSAQLAGEMSGHIFFKDRWYGFDDAIYAAARLLEILAKDPLPPGKVLSALPGGVATPELKIDLPESQHDEFMTKLKLRARFDAAEVQTVDGLRVDYADAWGLIRPSNTTPCLVLRFEADSEIGLQRIQAVFGKLIKAVDARLKLPF